MFGKQYLWRICFLCVIFFTSGLLYAQQQFTDLSDPTVVHIENGEKKTDGVIAGTDSPKTFDNSNLFSATHFDVQKEDSTDITQEKKIYITLRFGLGSSRHLGESSQLTLDIKPGKIPIIFSFLSESYRKTPLKKEYAEPNDIFLYALNVLYTRTVPGIERVNLYMGGGLGRLEVEKYERSDDPDWRQKPYAIEKGFIYDLQAGIHSRLFWKIGLYTEGKYLYAKKQKNRINVIDVNSTAWMIGLTLNFGLFDNA